MAEVKIITHDHHAKWYEYHNQDVNNQLHVYGRGYAFFNGQYYEGKQLIYMVWNQCCKTSLVDLSYAKNICKKLNGAWALIFELPAGKYIAATDRFRNIPIFYIHKDNQIIVAASIDDIIKRAKSIKIKEENAIEFMLTRTVNCGDTLYDGVHQLMPGEIISITVRDGLANVHRDRYYRFFPEVYSNEDEDELEQRLSDTIHAVFKRFAQSLQGELLLLPLSGGLDSRLIAAMLKKFGHDNVLCYTYGYQNNPEAVLSQNVAKFLGYKWKVFETPPEYWGSCALSEEMMNYWDYSFKGSCVPHIGDYPAISMIQRDEKFDKNVRVWPGIAMDFLAGSLLDKVKKLKARFIGYDLAEEYILRRRYNLWPVYDMSNEQVLGFYQKYNFLRKRLKKTLEVEINNNVLNPYVIYEMFEAEHRISYVLNNSLRLYEFFNIKWHLPFWDYELVDFFLKVPLEFRFKERLYSNTLRDKIFSGPLAKLREIPVYDYVYKFRNWNSRVTDENMVKEFLNKCNRWFILRFQKDRPVLDIRFHNYDYMFSRCQEPKMISVYEALKPYGAIESLPEQIFNFLKPWLSFRLDRISRYAILSVIMVMKAYDAVDS